MSLARPPHRKNRAAGWTLIELLVVASILAILAGLLVPACQSALASARSAKCVSNLRQIGIALNSYAGDNNNCYPAITDPVSKKDWDQAAIAPYLPLKPNGRQNAVMVCPAAQYAGARNPDLSRTYSAAEGLIGLNGGQVAWTYGIPRNRNTIQHESTTLLLFEGAQSGGFTYCNVVTTWTMISGTSDLKAGGTTSAYVDFRHKQGMRLLMGDGHVADLLRANASSITQGAWQGL